MFILIDYAKHQQAAMIDGGQKGEKRTPASLCEFCERPDKMQAIEEKETKRISIQ
jgi:hypothetical protein